MAADGMTAYFLEPDVFSHWLRERVAASFGISPDPDSAGILLVRVGYRIDARVLDGMPSLRVLVSPTTGVDHIDLDECARRNVAVLTLRGHREFLENLTNTAEHAFALLLALYRRLVPAYRDVLSGNWRQADHRGHTLAGRKFGIVGYGRLGAMAAQMARGFGMTVLAYDPCKSVASDNVAQVRSIHDLAEEADVMSLHADLNDMNHGMIDMEVLDRMPDHGILINTARGQLIDEDALLRTLRSGGLAGAGLDVICSETAFGGGNPLLQYAREHDNLLLTPHIGGQTYEAVTAADKFIYSELERWCTANAS